MKYSKAMLLALALVTLSLAEVYVSVPMTTITVTYTELKVSQGNKTAIVFKGECYPYGVMATFMSGTVSTIVNVGYLETLQGTSLVPEVKNVATVPFTPTSMANGIVKMFCTNVELDYYDLSASRVTVTTVGYVTLTSLIESIETYMVPSLATTSIPGFVIATATWVPSVQTFLSPTYITVAVSGTTVLVNTYSLLKDVEFPQGALPVVKPVNTEISEVPTTITVAQSAIGANIPLYILTDSSSMQNVTANTPIVSLVAVGLAGLAKRFKRNSNAGKE